MLSQLSIQDFLNETASGTPVPGGGSVSALCGSLAASLVKMVTGLTIGKKGFEGVEEKMKTIAADAERIGEALVRDIDNDSRAYAAVVDAFRMPKGNDEEKKKRSEAIQAAFINAADVPFRVAGHAAEILELAGFVVENGNRNAVTDGLVAVMTARTAVRGALFNVRINLGSIKDAAYVGQMTEQVRRMENEITEKEKAILSGIKI